MIRLKYLSLCLTLFVSGCRVGSFPNVPLPESELTVMPPMSGSVFGGHAPIVGAQVYVLTPSLTANSGQSASLMAGDTQNSILTPTGTGNGLVSSGGTNGYHYVTTDATGSFTLTGDYACTVDQAVYVVAVGGSPTFPSASNVFQVNQEVVSNLTGSGATETATYTFTTTTTQNFYEGEQVTLSNFTGNFSFLPTTETVTVTNLTTTTFSFTAIDNSGGITAGTYTNTGTVTANPSYNPAVINMTALGLCPSSLSFSGSVNYIYMNEVSTAAMATAMAAFGSGPFNVGVQTGGPVDAHYASYDKNGMKQAMNNAGLLYNFEGGNLSTTYAGEGHIARTVTPAGNGIVPQTLLDTLGNILAACVDSQNTTATASTQCITLFENATSTGQLCTAYNASSKTYTCPSGTTAPADIATAAFNIAHYPAGTGTSTATANTFTTNLFNLPTGNVPFAPYLTAQPNDFSVAIAFFAPSAAGSTTNYINAPQVIAINGGNYVGNESNYTSDAAGEIQESVWIGNFGTGSGSGSPTVKLYANGGAPDYTTNTALNSTAVTGNTRSVVIDGSNNVWMISEFNENAKEFSVTGSLIQTFTIPTALNEYEMLDASIDGAGTSYNLYIAGYVLNNIIKAAVVNGTTPSATNLETNNVAGNAAFSKSTATTGSGTAACAEYSSTLAFAPSTTPVLYLNEDSNIYSYGTNNSSVCTINTTTGAQAVTGGNGSGFFYQNVGEGPATVAVDSSGKAWIGGGESTAGVAAGLNSITSTGTVETYTGGGMNDPCGVAIDGANSIWVGNAGTYGVSHFSNAGVALSPVAATSINSGVVGGLNPQINKTYEMPGTTTSLFAPTVASNCASPAIDRAGDIWMAYQGSAAPVPGVVFEILGIAAPLVTPRSYATFGNGTTGFLGERPY